MLRKFCDLSELSKSASALFFDPLVFSNRVSFHEGIGIPHESHKISHLTQTHVFV